MLSIIINHYKSPEVLKLCLQYIKKNVPEEFSREIIVTDSETTEKTYDMMRFEFPNIKFIQAKENIGFAKSVNKGIKSATGDIFLIMNADVIIPNKNSFLNFINFFQKHGEIGIAGPRLLNINGERQPSCFRFYSIKTIFARRTPFGKTPWGEKELDRFLMRDVDLKNKEYIEADWIMGSVMLVRKKALENVGFMSENYFMYMEDVDWCRKFWEKGWKVAYYLNDFFYHYHFQASKKRGALLDAVTNKYSRIHITSALKYFKRHGLKVPRYGI